MKGSSESSWFLFTANAEGLTALSLQRWPSNKKAVITNFSSLRFDPTGNRTWFTVSIADAPSPRLQIGFTRGQHAKSMKIEKKIVQYLRPSKIHQNSTIKSPSFWPNCSKILLLQLQMHFKFWLYFDDMLQWQSANTTSRGMGTWRCVSVEYLRNTWVKQNVVNPNLIFYYPRCVTQKCVTSDRIPAPLRVIVPAGSTAPFQMSQPWRTLSNTVSDLNGLSFNLQISCSRDERITGTK